MALEHGAEDLARPVGDLLAERGGDLCLLEVILLAVSMRAVDEDRLREAFRPKLDADLGDVIGFVVGAGSRTAAKNHMAVVVARGLKDRADALLGDRRKPMRGSGAQDRIHRDLGAAVRAVLEADRRGKP